MKSAAIGTPRAKLATRPQPWRRVLLFASTFVRHPLQLGSFAQSSPALVRRLLDAVDWSECRNVVELGPGVGAVTRAVLQRLPRDGRLLAIEIQPAFVARLREELADSRLRLACADATEAPRLLQESGLPSADLVISGVPLRPLSTVRRERLLDAARATLADGGQMLIYQHSRRSLPALQHRFRSVEQEIEWRSLLPMRVFRCRDPGRSTASGS